jgi:hypothetical protein
MSVSGIINPATGKIYDELVPQGGGVPLQKGGLITADAQGKEQPLAVSANNGWVLSANSNTQLGLEYIQLPAGGINFTAEGQLLYAGAGPAFADSLLNIGNSGQILEVANGIPSWVDMGGSGKISANPPLFEEADPAPNSLISINFSNAVGEIPYGTGTKVGALTNVPTAGQILGMAGNPLVPTWIQAPSNVDVIVYRNSVDNVPLANIPAPLTANSTCIIVADRTYQTFSPATIYSQAFVNPQAGSQDLLANSAWFNWTAPADLELTGFTGSFYIASNQQFPDGTQILCGCSMVNTTTSAIVASAQFSIAKDGATSYNFTGTPQAPPPLIITNGQVFQFQITIDGQIPLGGSYFASNNGTGLVGVMNIQANQYTNSPASFVLTPPAKFRTNNDLVGKSSATCTSFASQSFVASGDLKDWVLVGGENGGVQLVP